MSERKINRINFFFLKKALTEMGSATKNEIHQSVWYAGVWIIVGLLEGNTIIREVSWTQHLISSISNDDSSSPKP